jgi:hypothetical protein
MAGCRGCAGCRGRRDCPDLTTGPGPSLKLPLRFSPTARPFIRGVTAAAPVSAVHGAGSEKNMSRQRRFAPPVSSVERIKNMQTIEAINSTGEVVHTFASQAEAVQHGFCQRSVGECLLGNRPTHKGLRWRRVTQGVDTPSVADQLRMVDSSGELLSSDRV